MDKKHEERKEPKSVTSCGAVTWMPSGSTAKVLLIKQFANDDVWGMPKGHINEGEDIMACAVREVREETGVDVSLLERLPDCQSLSRKKHKTVVTFLAVPKDLDATEPNHTGEHSEVDDAKWFTLEEAAGLRFIAYQSPVINEAIERIKQILQREWHRER